MFHVLNQVRGNSVSMKSTEMENRPSMIVKLQKLQLET